jgi:hypothetical protein
VVTVIQHTTILRRLRLDLKCFKASKNHFVEPHTFPNSLSSAALYLTYRQCRWSHYLQIIITTATNHMDILWWLQRATPDDGLIMYAETCRVWKWLSALVGNCNYIAKKGRYKHYKIKVVITLCTARRRVISQKGTDLTKTEAEGWNPANW